MPQSSRGQLAIVPGKSARPSSRFLSDPAHPLTDPYESYGAHDYRSFVGRNDVLTFDSEPLREDTEITGPIRAEIYLETAALDVDLWVRLLDVSPDTTAFNLMSPGSDTLRASYRHRGLRPEKLHAGQIYRLEISGLVTGNVFLAGHRIRAQVSGAFFPHFSRNLQTGESETTSAHSVPALIRIYHDAKHPSRLLLPVIPR